MNSAAENSSGHFSEEFVLNNPYGLHARPASVFVQTAMEFQSDVQVCNLSNNMTADGKSVLSMLMLAAPVGTRIRITVDGQDASRAMDSLRNLVLRGFDDE
ncbi:MAG: HPr family phosphocarrier protein [Lentisphaeria bacterium]|nr:HPr family phosphocarrier protein [Lentisphaeria bacterium]